MSLHLLLFAAADTPQIDYWAVVETATPIVLRSGAGLPAMADHADVSRSALILAGVNVACHALPLPRRITPQVLAALPQLMIDRLASPESRPHCAVGAKQGDDTLVAVVDHSYFALLIAGLQAAGIEPDLALADYMLLPTDDADVCGIELPDVLLIATADGRGAAVDRAVAPRALAELVPATAQKLLWYGGDIGAAWGQAGQVDTRPGPDRDAFALLLAPALDRYSSINFISGAFRRRGHWQVPRRNRKRIGLLTASAVLLTVFAIFAAGWQLNRQAVAVDGASHAEMHTVFPRATSLSYLRAKLRELEGHDQNQFLALSHTLFAVTAAEASASIRQLHYDGRQSQLTVQLQVDSLTTAEHLEKQLKATGQLTLVNQSSRQAGQVFQTTLTLEPVR
ncbi:type II secretion system protein GspL [Kordiimonas marina]|uniref:type II secretion system protein GspL n=1 Tax=Kordiimonas marina TaxID=2872312 RepID=UPI001FF2078E|nr:type II secretion system protein GspL [Kordiimonas marina]MCJ9430053.1 hypothetical protein [Kordiimonas marina]